MNRRRFFVRWAGCSHRPHESTKACVPAPPREGRCFPESRGAFHRLESWGLKIALHSSRPTSSMTPPLHSRGASIATGDASAFISTPTCLTLTRQASGAWLGRSWPGVVPGFARTYRSAPERFLQPVLLASRILSLPFLHVLSLDLLQLST